MRELTVIDASLVRAMIQDKKYRDTFPFLQHAANQLNSASCSRCKRKQHRDELNLTNSVLQAIAGMPSSKKVELKHLLQTNKVRLHYTTTAGKMQRLTF